MATKKQKREAAEAKRERMLAAERQVGLDALKKDQEKRRRLEAEAKGEERARNARLAARLNELKPGVATPKTPFASNHQKVLYTVGNSKILEEN